MPNRWDVEVFQHRSDPKTKRGHVPGSPDPAELSTYMECVADKPPSDALVMGMTVGLRELLHSRGDRVTCIDKSDDAIEFLRDGVATEHMARETVIVNDWLGMPANLPSTADIVVGDGVFANVLDGDGQKALIDAVRATLRTGGVFVTRTCLVPVGFDFGRWSADALIADFRRGAINEAEFGHGMRIWGCYDDAYDPETFLLDNRIVYETYDEWLGAGALSPEEYAAVMKQFFGGHHFYPPQHFWESLLSEAGFECHMQRLVGYRYYEYLPIYACRMV